MNNRENALKLRVRKLEEQTAIQKLMFDRLMSDLDTTESAGCAFSFDVGLYGLDAALLFWEDAMKAGALFQNARQWLRDQVRKDATFRKTAIEAAGKNPDLVLETPFGGYSIRLLSAT